MTLLSWTALMAGGIAVGAGLVLALVLPSRWDVVATILPVAGVAASVAGLQGIIALSHRFDTAAFAVFLATAASIGGYALAASLLASVGDRATGAYVADRWGPSDPCTLVVLVSCAEDEHYRPSAVVQVVREMRAVGAPAPPDAALPFVCAAEKARYRLFGPSPARHQVRALTGRVAGVLEEDGAAVLLAWCGRGVGGQLDDPPASLRHVVVAPLAVTTSPLVEAVRRSIDERALADRGVRTVQAPSPSSSPRLTAFLADRFAAAAGPTDDDTAGVVLVAEGQPAGWDETDPASAEQETYFGQRIRALLAERGLDPGRVQPAWLEWRAPDVTETVRHLAAFGARRVVVAPYTTPADSFTTLVDLPQAVAQARLDPSVRVQVLGGWGDEEEVALAIAETVRAAVAEASDQG